MAVELRDTELPDVSGSTSVFPLQNRPPLCMLLPIRLSDTEVMVAVEPLVSIAKVGIYNPVVATLRTDCEVLVNGAGDEQEYVTTNCS